jgi:hypothetical protein
MNILLWFLLIVIVLILSGGLALSFYFTHRASWERHMLLRSTDCNQNRLNEASDGIRLRCVDPCPGSDKVWSSCMATVAADFDVYRAPALHEAG